MSPPALAAAGVAPPRPRPALAVRRLHTTGDAVVAAAVSLLVLVVFVALAPHRRVDWFLAPTFICGVLIGADMVAWLRGRLDLFDPVGLLGGYGYYFFFLAPLLMMLANVQPGSIPAPADWVHWVGWTSVLNLAGLLVYRAGRSVMLRRAPDMEPRLTSRSRLVLATLVVVPSTFAVAVFTLASLGGLQGIIDVYSEKNPEAFSGLGLQFLVGESFPNAVAMALLVWKRRAFKERPWLLVLLAVGFFALRIVFGGMRGSRSNTIWALIWLGGAIHLWIRPLRWRTLVISVACILAFAYVYSFYKAQGRTALERMSTLEGFSEVSGTSSRTPSVVLVSDFSRANIQPLVAQRVWESPSYRLGLGATYLDSAAILLPKAVRGDRGESKVAKGTEAIFGQGTFVAQSYQASWVYGLLGEAMLNFHVVLAPLAFLALAAWVSMVRNAMHSLHPDDVRRLLLPIGLISGIAILSGDSDNVVVFLLRTGLVPLVFVWLVGRRARQGGGRRPQAAAP